MRSYKPIKYNYLKLAFSLSLIPLLFDGCVPKIDKVNAINQYDIKNDVAANMPDKTNQKGSLAKDWWKVYGDEQLNAMLKKALLASPTIKSVEERYKQASVAIDTAKANAMPQYYALSAISRERFSPNDFLPPPFGGGYYSRYQAGASIGYEFDFWHKKDFEISMGQNIALSKKASLEAAKLALTNAVCSLYVSWDFDEKRIAILDEESKLVLEQLSAINTKYKRGLANSKESIELRITLSKLSAAVSAIKRDVVAKKEMICILIGEHPSYADKMSKPNINVNNALPLPKEIYLDILSHRPDISTQKGIVLAKADKIEIQKTSYYPNINLSAFLGVNSLDFTKFLDASSYAPKIQSAISLPIFDWGKRDSELKDSVSDYNAAVYEYNALVISAANEIVGILKKIKLAESENEIVKKEVYDTKELEKIANSRLKAGLESKIGHLGAKINTLNANMSELSAQETTALLRLSLIKAVGGGYTEEKSKK